MRARYIIYMTGGGPDPPPAPEDPSIAEAAAKRESVAIIQAQARRSGRYGQASLQLDKNDKRPSTTEPSGGPKGLIDQADVDLPIAKKFAELTDAEKATNAARTLDYEVQRLMARRNSRIGVTSTLGNN
jgi:hypothetical protein